MNILRDPKQLALNDLLVAMQELVDNYRDLMEVLKDPAVAVLFQDILIERKPLLDQLKLDIRRQDELPSVPDADRGDVGKLVHRVRAAISDHEVVQAVDEMIAAERHILALTVTCRVQPLTDCEQSITDKLSMQVDHTLSRLHKIKIAS